MCFEIPKLMWPLEWAKKEGFYFFSKEIEKFDSAHVFLKDYGEMIMFSSYSYLGLFQHPEIENSSIEAIRKYSTGTHGARLLAGTLPIHIELEKKISNLKQTDDALVFSSGYMANIGTITSLVGRGDYVLSDKINHASIVDGCRFSNAKHLRFKHNDIENLEKRLKLLDPQKNKLVVADAVFSMDGDIFNLPDAVKVCKKYGALLMIDEAHSLGVIGENGLGIEEYYNLPPDSIDVKMGTLSKTIPSAGGYIASSKKIIELLKHNSRCMVYSGSLAPAQVAAAIKAIDIIQNEKWRIKKLHKNVDFILNKLNNIGFSTLNSKTAIIPIICESNEKSWRMAKHCQENGLFIQGIPSPVVPEGLARLRCIITANHSIEDLKHCVSIIEESGKKENVI